MKDADFNMIFSQKLAERYNELKKEVPDCILLMQVGALICQVSHTKMY